MFRKELNYPLINFTVFLLLVWIGITNIQSIMAFFLHILSVLLPFLLGFIVAYAVNPFVVFLEKYVPRIFAVFIVIIFIIFLLLFLAVTIFPILYHQLANFTIQLLQIVSSLSRKFSISSGEIEVLLTQFFHQILENVGSFTTDKTFHLVGGVIQGASQLLVGCISFVYFLFYMKSIRQSFRTLLYQRHVKLYSYFSLLDCKMIRYVKGIGLLMFIQFVEYSFLFFLIGHPHWLVLGIFIGLFTAVPYVGGFVANTIAIVTAFMISKSLFYATLFVCFFFPVVDEYFISPKIYGKSNDIHPVITIFLLSIGGSVGGVLGIILSIPIYLFFRTTILFFQDDMKKGVGTVKDVL